MSRIKPHNWSDRVLDGQISSMANKISVEELYEKKAFMKSYLDRLKEEKDKREKYK